MVRFWEGLVLLRVIRVAMDHFAVNQIKLKPTLPY
jgi:hypothetical protein